MTNDPTFLNSVILIFVAFGGAFLAAVWLALVIWTWRDIRSRARDPLSQTLAVLVVAALNLPGVLVYLILRPAHTLEEEYQRTLEEEALLASIEDLSLCPGCERQVHSDWQVCPNCHTKLKKNCQRCEKLMELAWNICPYCGTPAPGMKLELEPVENVNPLPVDQAE
jgi:RNA polymerase subunit RPABC4/transcription elongation factor Spt4